jgi:hypothetical protein
MKRTYKDFVDDMKSRGRNPKLILAIAQSTHWVNFLEDIKKYIEDIKLKIRESKKLENS